MAPLKKSSISHDLQRRKIQLIFTTFLLLFLFSLLILLNTTPLTPNSLPSTTVPTATSYLLSASNYISSLSSLPKTSSIIPSRTFETGSNVAISHSPNPLDENRSKSPRTLSKTEHDFVINRKKNSCDIFDGKWVLDNSDPIYPPGSCPFLDYTFNCFNNGRSDLRYLWYRWQPNGCNIPRYLFFLFISYLSFDI